MSAEQEQLRPEDGPVGKPSQAEGDDVDEQAPSEPFGPVGKPSQAEGDDEGL